MIRHLLEGAHGEIQWVWLNLVLGGYYTWAIFQGLPYVEALGSLAIFVLMVYNLFRIKLARQELKIKRIEEKSKQMDLDAKRFEVTEKAVDDFTD
jgi:hypothetical protein